MEVEPTGLLGELDVGYEEKRRMCNFELFLLRNSWKELPFAEIIKIMGEVGLVCMGGGHERGVQPLSCWVGDAY